MRNKQLSSKAMQPAATLTIDYPHKLKPGQITEINKVVSTISKYENTLKNLSKASNALYKLFIDDGQKPGTEICEVWLTIRDLRVAMEPDNDDGDYSRDTGLVGKWNEERHCYDPYR